MFGVAAFQSYNRALSRGFSPKIWKRLDKLAQARNQLHGRFLYDDFETFDGLVTTNVGRYTGRYGYRSFENSSCTILPIATERDGVIRFTTDTTDNAECSMKLGGPAAVQCMISDAEASRRLVMFESRVRTNSIADTIAGIVVALTEENLAVTDGILADAGTFQDKDYVGFHRLEGDGDKFDTVYSKEGGSRVTLKADAVSLVADTWIKLGMLYEFDHQDGARLQFFADGEALTDYITADPLAATFPDGEELSPLWTLKNATTTAAQFDLDWFGLAEIVL